jgi:hypothetical protein
MKVALLAGGMGTRLAEETDAPEANRRDRRQADSLAHDETLLLLWDERVHYRVRLKERGDHPIFLGSEIITART